MAMTGRRRRAAVVAVVGCVLLAGCSDTQPQAAAQAAPSSAVSSPTATADMPPMAGGALSDTAGKSPADVALQLEALLGQHSVLVSDMMNSRIRNDDNLAQVATAAVTRNTDDLTAVVKAMFGDQAANAFRGTWNDHTTAFFNYARGLATNDPGVRTDARAQLVKFEDSLGDFFSAASQGRLPQDAARTTLATHVDHLLQQADAYAGHNYAKAADLYRTAYSHAFGIGQALASTLLPPAQSAALDQPSWRLRSELERLLGEHVALAVATLRAGATESPDFAATGNALNKNTDDLATAMGTLFGPAAGQQFLSLWADHIDALVNYTAGVAGHDTARSTAAQDKLRAFEGQLSTFLDQATGARMPTGDLSKAFLAHDQMLTQQVDASAGKDYAKATQLSYTAYQDMFTLSQQLSNAFGEMVATRLPRGGAETGAGGMSGAPGTR
jgi:hypothetical protein